MTRTTDLELLLVKTMLEKHQDWTLIATPFNVHIFAHTNHSVGIHTFASEELKNQNIDIYKQSY